LLAACLRPKALRESGLSRIAVVGRTGAQELSLDAVDFRQKEFLAARAHHRERLLNHGQALVNISATSACAAVVRLHQRHLEMRSEGDHFTVSGTAEIVAAE
jgi:hypothetical protein